MDSSNYLGYIAYYHKNIIPLIPKDDFLELCKEHLGKDLFSSSINKTRDFARLLYKSYVASTYSRYTAFHIASKLTSKQIEDYVNDTIVLNKKYGVFYDTVDYDFKPSVIDAGIAKNTIAGYTTILKALTAGKAVVRAKSAAPKKAPIGKTASPKKAPVKKTATGKTPAKVGVRKTTVGEPVKRKVVIKSTTGKTPAKVGVRKTTTTARASPKKYRGCKEMTVTELKQFAKLKKIYGYSKMTKAELCKATGIK